MTSRAIRYRYAGARVQESLYGTGCSDSLKLHFLLRGQRNKERSQKWEVLSWHFSFRKGKLGHRIIRKKRQMKAGECQGAERSQVCMLFFNQARVGLKRKVRD